MTDPITKSSTGRSDTLNCRSKLPVWDQEDRVLSHKEGLSLLSVHLKSKLVHA